MSRRSQIHSILDRIEYLDWEFFLSDSIHPLYLQVHFGNHSTGPLHGRKWLLSEHMTESEIVQTALLAVLTAVEHEAREAFKVDGRNIFNPHHRVDDLLELHRTGSPDRRMEPAHTER